MRNPRVDPVMKKDLFWLNFKRYVAGDFTYYCYSEPGTALDATGWMIKRIENVAGEPDRATFADGSTSFGHVAANYATYSYS